MRWRMGLNYMMVTYGVVIEAYCKGKKSGEVLNFLDDTLRKKYIPNSALFWWGE